MKRLTAMLVCLLLALSLGACGTGSPGSFEESDDRRSGFLQTSATDDYGRSFGAVDGYNDKVVGIFYFLWLSQASQAVTVDSYVEEGRAEAALTGDEVAYAPTFTYWGEPMYGFYRLEDEWVVRKHVELFMNAGLDFICFDTTNNDYYRAASQSVLDVLLEYHEMGYDVPKVMFMTNSDSTGMTTSIYNAFYRRDTYDDIWFRGNGDKPWIIANYTGTNQDILDRFYFKPAQWPNRAPNREGFPWISWHYPQETYTDEANDYTIMSVSASQHTGIGGSLSDVGVSGINFSISGLFAPYNYDTLSQNLKDRYSAEQADRYYNYNWGRGYSHETGTNSYEDALKNVNFEQQWQSVYDNEEVNLVFITGWNEWIAQKQSRDPLLGADYGYFVDTFSMEFSRDIEMMKGGYLDNCFLQMVKNIRAYKGEGEGVVREGTESADMFELSSWNEVASYADLVKETEPRDYMGAGVGTHYTNDTGRNDIREVRVSHDADNLYFLIVTVDDITQKQASDTRWMNLFIGVEGTSGGWNDLQFVVNRSLNGTTASLDRLEDESFVPAGNCTTRVEGNTMIVQVPRSALGIGSGAFGITFKVADNLQSDFDITDLYTNGDCAPIGRINYTYRGAALN